MSLNCLSQKWGPVHTAAYNAAFNLLQSSRGQSSSPFSGSSLIQELQSALYRITAYRGENTAAQLGLTFDAHGKLSFDSSVLNALPRDQIQAFLGSAQSGGFLQSATAVINGIDDSSNGLIPNAITSTNKQISDTNAQVDREQTRIDQLHSSLNAQMATADALIASLQQKVSYFTNLFNAEYNSSRNG